MNKQQIINILNKYNFDKDKYIVIPGVSMVLYGIKDKTNDIDISTKKEYYNYLLKTYNCILEKENELGNNVYFIDGMINFGIDYYSTEKEYLNGIPVQKVEDILRLKEKLHRNKDIEDIKLIKNYIKQKTRI